VSSSCTKLPAVPTKFHTMAASASTPWSCFVEDPPSTASLEKDDAVCAGSDDFRLRIEETWPLVFRMAPEVRSSTMLPLTPGFLERRLSVSSRASGPVACGIPCQISNFVASAVRLAPCRANLPKLDPTFETGKMKMRL